MVTGCLGFVGGHLTRRLLADGVFVHGVDKITYAANEELINEFEKSEKDGQKNFKFNPQDICDLGYLPDCDYIINFAASSHVDNSIADSTDFIDSNVRGVKNLLDLIRAKNNTAKRPTLLHVSTDEVYGDIKAGDHFEGDPLHPSNPYSAAKACADMLILAWHRTYGIQYRMIRPTNMYGEGQFPEKLVPLSVKNLDRGKKIRLHDKGEPTRNWLHVLDCVEAVLVIMKNGTDGEIYNCCGGYEQANWKTVEKICKAYFAGISSKEILERHIDMSFDRLGQDVRYSLNDDKLRELGWRPTRVFDNEIVRIVKQEKGKSRW